MTMLHAASRAKEALRGLVPDGAERRFALRAASAYFLALASYYVLKTTREPLVLATGGAMLKSASTGIQAMVLLALLPVHARLAARVGTRVLFRRVGQVALSGIVLFAALAQLRSPYVGAAFYVFTGILGVGAVAQLGMLIADAVAPDRARRILPVALAGATFGGIAGSAIAAQAFSLGVGASGALLVSAALFAAQLRVSEGLGTSVEAAALREDFDERPVALTDGFAMLRSGRGLLLFAAFVLVSNLVNTNGELVLADRVTAAAHEAFEAAAVTSPGLDRESFVERSIGVLYGEFFAGVNVATVVMQLFLAGVLARVGGARLLLLVPVLVSLGVYGAATVGAAMVVFQAGKTLENAADYSLGATGRTLLWVDRSRAERVVAKPFIDTVVVRIGDVVAAAFVAIGGALGLRAEGFIWMNVALSVALVALAAFVVRGDDARRAAELPA